MNARSEARQGADWAQRTLRRLGARLAPGAGGFLSWWGQNLAAWLPLRLRRIVGFDRGRVLLQVQGVDSLLLRLQQGGDVRDLGAVPGVLTAAAQDALVVADPLAPLLPARVADLPRYLLLPAAAALRRRLTLPSAAAERLRDVVGFEIDRQTPFSADAVAFDARVLGRREPGGQLDVELIVVPRQRLDAQLTAIGALAPSLAGVDIAGDDGVPLGVNLLPPSQRRREADAFARWNFALAVVAVVAVAAAMWQLLDNRRIAADELEATIERHAVQARRAAAQRQELVALVQGQAFLDRTRAERPAAIAVIDDLTQRLPDTTYLEKLAIEDNSLMLIGLSSEAPSLIQRLQGSPLWRAPALTGALMPDPSSGRDRFTLTAEIGPAAAAKNRSAPAAEADDGQ